MGEGSEQGAREKVAYPPLNDIFLLFRMKIASAIQECKMADNRTRLTDLVSEHNLNRYVRRANSS